MQPIIVHEIEDGVFVPWPSGRPLILTCRQELVRVTRGGTVVSEKMRKCAAFEIEEAAPPVPGIWVNHSDKELADRKLYRAQPFVVPEGKQVAGEARYERGADGIVRQVFDVEDIPPPAPEPTRTEKVGQLLDRFGLTREELLAEIGGTKEETDAAVRG